MNRIFLFLREIRVEITLITNVMGILLAGERDLFEPGTTVLVRGNQD